MFALTEARYHPNIAGAYRNAPFRMSGLLSEHMRSFRDSRRAAAETPIRPRTLADAALRRWRRDGGGPEGCA